jgi:hypothetical protein
VEAIRIVDRGILNPIKIMPFWLILVCSKKWKLISEDGRTGWTFQATWKEAAMRTCCLYLSSLTLAN